jgi:hypothetical protein
MSMYVHEEELLLARTELHFTSADLHEEISQPRTAAHPEEPIYVG